MAPFSHLPIELLFKITEHLDILSIVRLTWISSYFHYNIGVSRAFWLRYCRILLEDERLPPFCFQIDSLEDAALVKLATRRERLARATLAGEGPGPSPAKRTQFALDHEPDLDIPHWTYRLAPGGRWAMALAWRKLDNTGHVLCWDVRPQNDEATTSICPVASVQIDLPPTLNKSPELSRLSYNPESRLYHFFITVITEADHDITHEVTAFPYNERAGRKFLDRWAIIHSGRSDLTSIAWDSQSGRTDNHSLDPSSPESFHTLVVTCGGTIFQVRGQVEGDRLDVRVFRASADSTASFDSSARFEILSARHTESWPAHSWSYAVTPHGPMRLAQGEAATMIQVQCNSVPYKFSSAVALSENGTVHKLPLVDEPWRLNEHAVPRWIARPKAHMDFSGTPNYQQSLLITEEHKELFLFVAPEGFSHKESEPGQGLLAVPLIPSDVGVWTNDWLCKGLCPRSGTWIVTRRSENKWLTMIRDFFGRDPHIALIILNITGRIFCLLLSMPSRTLCLWDEDRQISVGATLSGTDTKTTPKEHKETPHGPFRPLKYFSEYFER
ncbi:hypothetical protein DL93DRAFT_2154573, partial [Clavulina sp. PMI_390]